MKCKLQRGDQIWRLICHLNKRRIILQTGVWTRKNGLELLQVVRFGNVNIQRNQWEKSVISLRFVYADIAWCHLQWYELSTFAYTREGWGTILWRETYALTFVTWSWREKGFLSTVFQLLSLIAILLPKWHSLISLIIPGRNLITVEIGKISTRNQTSRNVGKLILTWL